VYGRLSVGKGFLSICSRWLVRPCIRPVGAAFHAPLAIMPFARLRSRSGARTRSARPQWVFLIRRYQPALCISSSSPFPTSSTIPRLVQFTRQPAPDIARHLSSVPRPSAQSYWRAQQRQPWSSAVPSVARARGAWFHFARHNG